MSSSSIPPEERSRKIESTILHALPRGVQTAIAVSTGISEPTITKMKTDQLKNWSRLLAYAGLQVVSADDVMVDITTYEAVTSLVVKAMSTPEIAQQLLLSPQK